MDFAQLVERFKQGDRRALARAITRVESGSAEAAALVGALYPLTGHARVIGVTGPPGAGKSTLVNRLAAHYRQAGQTVAIVAVDPTSPFSGGAILGDRIRMAESLADPGIFMRSLASRGHLGGISAATGDVISLLDAFGFAVILVETVGAGQSEVEIMQLAHTTCVVSIPGMGDDIQAIKAGILEIGDLFVVNKADRDGADRTVQELESMLDLAHMGEAGINRWGSEVRATMGTLRRLDQTSHHTAVEMAGAVGIDRTGADDGGVSSRHGSARPGDVSWRPPVVKTVARDNQGTVELAAQLEQHFAFLVETGRWEQRRRQDAAARLTELIAARAARLVLDRAAAAGDLERLASQVADRSSDPYAAADEILTRHLK